MVSSLAPLVIMACPFHCARARGNRVISNLTAPARFGPGAVNMRIPPLSPGRWRSWGGLRRHPSRRRPRRQCSQPRGDHAGPRGGGSS